MTEQHQIDFGSNIVVEYDRNWVNGTEVAPTGLRLTVNGQPRVVIDPENSAEIDSLAALIRLNGGGCRYQGMSIANVDRDFAALRAALRSMAGFPKLEEPTDPRVCVEDRRENIWRLLADGDWVCTSGPDIGEYLTWPKLVERGARVASQGVAS